MSAPPCCEPCRQQMQSCSTDVACCLQCHFSWEEANCGPYLPGHILTILREEHRRLAAAGFPPQDMARHSKWEEAIYRQYCPVAVVAQVQADHEAWESGRLRSRV